MTSSDPFADVQVPSAAPAQPKTTAPDPFASASASDDPFATSSDYRGGDYVPSPSIEHLSGRLIVMVPRTLDPNAKDPFDPDGVKTRELYTVDLTVLTGGRLVYPYKVKGDPEKGTVDEWKEWEVDELPFSVAGYWVPQGGVIGKLKKSHADGRPFLGVPSMGPQKVQRDKGVTAAQVQAEYASWVARGKPGNAPKFTWIMDEPSPAQRAIAIAWWASVRESIAPITPSN